jgi:hypothetical protein
MYEVNEYVILNKKRYRLTTKKMLLQKMGNKLPKLILLKTDISKRLKKILKFLCKLRSPLKLRLCATLRDYATMDLNRRPAAKCMSIRK